MRYSGPFLHFLLHPSTLYPDDRPIISVYQQKTRSCDIADDIAEWIEVLEDTALLDPTSSGALVSDSLKVACKNKNYHSTVLFTALVDFYRWMPRMGRTLEVGMVIKPVCFT
jgi:hypothetical protein